MRGDSCLVEEDVEGNWVPGKRITDRQMNEYRRYRLVHSQEAAAAKGGERAHGAAHRDLASIQRTPVYAAIGPDTADTGVR
jgi:hypothetical protein